MDGIPTVFYLCDGKIEDCKKRTCYKKGGDCKHTTNIKHAINFGRKTKSKMESLWELDGGWLYYDGEKERIDEDKDNIHGDDEEQKEPIINDRYKDHRNEKTIADPYHSDLLDPYRKEILLGWDIPWPV